MTYQELGFQFIEFFANIINYNHQELVNVLTNNTMMTFNGEEGQGEEQIMYCFNFLQLHNLRFIAKNVMVQPLYIRNQYKVDMSGLLIQADGSVNTLENGIIVNKNVHFSFVLENTFDGPYYITNILMRMSEKSRQLNQNQGYQNQGYQNQGYQNRPYNTGYNTGYIFNNGLHRGIYN